MRSILLAVVLLFLPACAVATCAVTVVAPDGQGRGAVVAPDRVATVAHVAFVGEGPEFWPSVLVDGHPAHVATASVGMLPEGLDGLALLQLDDGYRFDPSRVATQAPRGQGAPTSYLGQDGRREWPYGIRPGDSGSPVLDQQGRLVGLVAAVYGIDVPCRQGDLPDQRR